MELEKNLDKKNLFQAKPYLNEGHFTSGSIGAPKRHECP